MLAGQDMNVNVLRVLIWRQHAESNHEAPLKKIQRNGDLLNAVYEPVPDVDIANSELEDCRNPFFRNDDDVHVPPLVARRVDAVTKGEDMLILIDDFVGSLASTIEASTERMCRVGLLPCWLRIARDESRKENCILVHVVCLSELYASVAV